MLSFGVKVMSCMVSWWGARHHEGAFFEGG